MTLDNQRSLLAREVVDDINKYKENRNKWERLGLSDDDFHLAISEHSTRYNRKDHVTEVEYAELRMPETGWRLGSLIQELSKLQDKHGTNAILSGMHVEDDYYDSGNMTMTISSAKPETDRQLAIRIRKSMAQRYAYATSHEERKAKMAKELSKAQADILARAKKLGLNLVVSD